MSDFKGGLLTMKRLQQLFQNQNRVSDKLPTKKRFDVRYWFLGFAIPIVLIAIFPRYGDLNSHTNVTKSAYAFNDSTRATTHIDALRGKDNVLMVMAFSGGGSRAAYLSGSVMLGMQDVVDGVDLLQEVDGMSSVSGGSLPAAYYGISVDPGMDGADARVWDEPTVKELMTRNYIARWFGNWFWPWNIVRYWLTAWDRTDIMAQTMADNLYDTPSNGNDLTLGNLRDDRPFLVLNATNGSSEDGDFGRLFTFTDEQFSELNSDINQYELARAVMGTATFPSVFSYMTIKDCSDAVDQSCKENHNQEDRYVHIFDGGNFDNLGLTTASTMIDHAVKKYDDIDAVVVILVDAYTGKSGVSKTVSDSRGFMDFIVDTNFIDASSSLLSANRNVQLARFSDTLKTQLEGAGIDQGRGLFYHITLDDIGDPVLRTRLKDISTNFFISEENAGYIDQAMAQLMTPDNHCLVSAAEIIQGGQRSGDFDCRYITKSN